MPIVRHPHERASCAATDPVAPAAPDTATVSPSFGFAISFSPKYAVRVVMPSTLSGQVSGVPSGTLLIDQSPCATA